MVDDSKDVWLIYAKSPKLSEIEFLKSTGFQSRFQSHKSNLKYMQEHTEIENCGPNLGVVTNVSKIYNL